MYAKRTVDGIFFIIYLTECSERLFEANANKKTVFNQIVNQGTRAPLQSRRCGSIVLFGNTYSTHVILNTYRQQLIRLYTLTALTALISKELISTTDVA
jgi:hypothetical protein